VLQQAAVAEAEAADLKVLHRLLQETEAEAEEDTVVLAVLSSLFTTH
jgi:hypothetical protein